MLVPRAAWAIYMALITQTVSKSAVSWIIICVCGLFPLLSDSFQPIKNTNTKTNHMICPLKLLECAGSKVVKSYCTWFTLILLTEKDHKEREIHHICLLLWPPQTFQGPFTRCNCPHKNILIRAFLGYPMLKRLSWWLICIHTILYFLNFNN